MNRELLDSKFPPHQIKTRQGNFGNTLAYLGPQVIQRLNDALNAAWNFEIVCYEVLEDEVLVLGRLTAGTVYKTQFGTSSITPNKTSGEVISLGDDLKAAATDALKKAATLLGVGLCLYQHNGNVQKLPVNGKQVSRFSASPIPIIRAMVMAGSIPVVKKALMDHPTTI